MEVGLSGWMRREARLAGFWGIQGVRGRLID